LGIDPVSAVALTESAGGLAPARLDARDAPSTSKRPDFFISAL
jgi:hypothetical protein